MLIDFLRKLQDPTSAERQLYRERKAAATCRLCGSAEPGDPFCAPCFAEMHKARADAKAQGICSSCFSRPVAPARSPRYRGRLTQCAACRAALTIRHAESALRRSMGMERTPSGGNAA